MIRELKIMHLIDVDGRSITLRILNEKQLPTHVELDVECIAAFPPTELLGKQFKIIAADYRPYIITGFIYNKLQVLVISGYIEAYKGYAYISYGLPYTEFIKRVSAEEKEPYYKALLEAMKLELATLKTKINECFGEKLNIVESLHKEYSRILDKYIEFYKKAVGLASPELQILVESILATTQPPTPPQPQPTQPTPPPKKGFLQKLKEMFKRR